MKSINTFDNKHSRFRVSLKKKIRIKSKIVRSDLYLRISDDRFLEKRIKRNRLIDRNIILSAGYF
jgi:hypothetical protein